MWEYFLSLGHLVSLVVISGHFMVISRKAYRLPGDGQNTNNVSAVAFRWHWS
jgi:hypothetical protein